MGSFFVLGGGGRTLAWMICAVLAQVGSVKKTSKQWQPLTNLRTVYIRCMYLMLEECRLCVLVSIVIASIRRKNGVRKSVTQCLFDIGVRLFGQCPKTWTTFQEEASLNGQGAKEHR